MTTIISKGMDKKAMFNAKNSSKNIKEIIGKNVEISGYMVANDTDKETGEIIKIGYMCLADGTVYGFKSSTLIDNVIEFDEYISDVYDDDRPFSEHITVSAVKSKAGREFYQFNIV